MKYVNKKNYETKVQHLIALIKEINCGRINHIAVRNGQPECTLKTTIQREIKLNGDIFPYMDTDNNKLPINKQILSLLQHMSDLENGTISCLEIRRGAPSSLVFEQTAISVTNDFSIIPTSSSLQQGGDSND